MNTITFSSNATKRAVAALAIAPPETYFEAGVDVTRHNDDGPWCAYWACVIALFLMHIA